MLHTHAYHEAVYIMLEEATTRGEAEAVLGNMRQTLRSGRGL